LPISAVIQQLVAAVVVIVVHCVPKNTLSFFEQFFKNWPILILFGMEHQEEI